MNSIRIADEDLRRAPIAKYLTGSRAYGMSRPDSDYDIRNVFVTHPVDRMMNPNVQTLVYVQNDEDVQSWDLWKLMVGIIKGNPNMIETICSPEILEDDMGITETLRSFVNANAVQGLMGVAEKHMKRPGHCLKDLSNSLRTARMAMEFLNTGRIKVRREDADYLNAVRSGEVPKERVIAEIRSILERRPEPVDLDYQKEMYRAAEIYCEIQNHYFS